MVFPVRVNLFNISHIARLGGTTAEISDPFPMKIFLRSRDVVERSDMRSRNRSRVRVRASISRRFHRAAAAAAPSAATQAAARTWPACTRARVVHCVYFGVGGGAASGGKEKEEENRARREAIAKGGIATHGNLILFREGAGTIHADRYLLEAVDEELDILVRPVLN